MNITNKKVIQSPFVLSGDQINNRCMKKILIFSFIIVLAGLGCEKAGVKDADLLNTKWILSSIQDTKTNAIINYPGDAAKKISIVFTDSLSVISFSGICNAGGGTYLFSASTGAIKITDLSTTKIGCKYDEWETYTVQNLYYAYSYKINVDNLIIYSDSAYNLYFNRN
jgi:heat shock protein HslJ